MNDADSLTLDTPIGMIAIRTHDDAIFALDWVDTETPRPNTPLLNEAARQLEAYFAGTLEDFDLPLEPEGTVHQKKVWTEMLTIPYGGLRTYGEIATAIGSAARAVGTACGKNPIPIIVPCHRVIATGGGMGGYSGRGGLENKQTLLTLEKALLA
jgi:methylated-DNA-[protein]-cysteine S-methyltransferase